MTFSKLLTLAVSASALATASTLKQRHPNLPVKRSDGTIIGAEPGISYQWNSTGTSAQCPALLVTDLQTSLTQFDSLFPPQYDNGPSYPSQTIWNIGALYLSYPEGTYAFALEYTSVTPNRTATWVNSGADIANVWQAVREDVVDLWSQGSTFQFIWKIGLDLM
ncbi:MAG: hypothetical protein Q9160_009242 [Pyrenula sp. 1 TL-2023]